MIKCVFHKEKLNAIDTVYDKHIYHSQSRPVFCENLTWQNSKGQVELANLTVYYTTYYHKMII